MDILSKNLVNETTYNDILSQVSLREITENPKVVYLECDNTVIVGLINRRYLHIFSVAIKNVTDDDYQVVIKHTSEYKERPKIFNPSSTPGVVNPINPIFDDEKIFDPSFTFENFVVGDGNSAAAAMCKAVAESPNTSLSNPLFIYGGSGLGKTHLLNAIGIYLLEHNQNIKILYVPAEVFTSDYGYASQTKKIDEFKYKYRSVDVFLLDDVQFLENKMKTQEEFYNTFNSLLQDGKRVIISGDRSPNNLISADDRLISRLLMNTTVGIYPPDLDTRKEILYKQANTMGIEIDEDINEIIDFIADKFKDNIRSLKGSLETVINVCREVNTKPTLSFAKMLLKDIVRPGSSVTPQKIKSAVAKYYNIKVSDLESTSRKAEFAYPRQIAMYLCRVMTDYSLPRIGNIFGNKHYSTVKHACDKIDGEIMFDEKLKSSIEEIKQQISLL